VDRCHCVLQLDALCAKGRRNGIAQRRGGSRNPKCTPTCPFLQRVHIHILHYIDMRQADIHTFVDSAGWPNQLTLKGVITAANKGIINKQLICNGRTALHNAVDSVNQKAVVLLLAAGANTNVKAHYGYTSVLMLCWRRNIGDILQLLINAGGSVNKVTDFGETPLTLLVRWSSGDAMAPMKVLLGRPELHLDAKCEGKTAEEWAVHMRRDELASTISQERARRERWSAFRSAWMAAIAGFFESTK
jgi:hypothetical protein